jgi:hypothetical protein
MIAYYTDRSENGKMQDRWYAGRASIVNNLDMTNVKRYISSASRNHMSGLALMAQQRIYGSGSDMRPCSYTEKLEKTNSRNHRT